MAVPDWPTTYGYNMFLFPISQWVGGIFYEHTHRLWASGVGLLTVILAVWLQWRSPDRGLARWGWIAVVLVCFQGLLGGLRVTLMRDQLGIFHASLAQAFLVLVSLLALFLSDGWRRWRETGGARGGGAAGWVTATTVLVFVQLVIAATMRHQHAGLAVPDFPLAYGRVWPPTDEAFLQSVNALRSDARDFHPITAFQVHLHMTHRIMALVIVAGVCWSARQLRREFGAGSLPDRLGRAWIATVLVQATLGASTVWFNKAADVATAHVVFGALCLVFGAAAVAFSRAVARPQVATIPLAGAPGGSSANGAGGWKPAPGTS